MQSFWNADNRHPTTGTSKSSGDSLSYHVRHSEVFCVIVSGSTLKTATLEMLSMRCQMASGIQHCICMHVMGWHFHSGAPVLLTFAQAYCFRSVYRRIRLGFT